MKWNEFCLVINRKLPHKRNISSTAKLENELSSQYSWSFLITELPVPVTGLWWGFAYDK